MRTPKTKTRTSKTSKPCLKAKAPPLQNGGAFLLSLSAARFEHGRGWTPSLSDWETLGSADLLPRGPFEDAEGVGQYRGGILGRLAVFQPLQHPQQRPAHPAGAVRPMRIDRDAFQAVEQQAQQGGRDVHDADCIVSLDNYCVKFFSIDAVLFIR